MSRAKKTCIHSQKCAIIKGKISVETMVMIVNIKKKNQQTSPYPVASVRRLEPDQKIFGPVKLPCTKQTKLKVQVTCHIQIKEYSMKLATQ